MAMSISIWKELLEPGRDRGSGEEEAQKAGEGSDELNGFAGSSDEAYGVKRSQSRSYFTCSKENSGKARFILER